MTDANKLVEGIMEQPVIAEQANEIGKNLLEAVINQLTTIPHPSVANQSVWSTMKQSEQDNIIERFTRVIKTEVLRGYRVIIAGGNPAARATLEKVVFSGKGIQATLTIDKHSKERHALADYADCEVAIIMPDELDEFFETMSEVESASDQTELPLDNDTIADPETESDNHADGQAQETDAAEKAEDDQLKEHLDAADQALADAAAEGAKPAPETTPEAPESTPEPAATVDPVKSDAQKAIDDAQTAIENPKDEPKYTPETAPRKTEVDTSLPASAVLVQGLAAIGILKTGASIDKWSNEDKMRVHKYLTAVAQHGPANAGPRPDIIAE